MSNIINSNALVSSKWDEYLKSLRAEKGTIITHTKIGNKGIQISGGQRQRIASEQEKPKKGERCTIS
jgi:ABC-type transport system involved in cytochrome bd biosynthesis fused ATPase/permease subunit